MAAAALPLAIALVVWAVTDLERFLLYAVLPTMIFPGSLAHPLGNNVALADVLLVIALCSWLVGNALSVRPDPWLRRNPLLVPAVLFVGATGASILWTSDASSTVGFTVQLIFITIVTPVAFGSLPTSAARIRRGLMILVWATFLMAV